MELRNTEKELSELVKVYDSLRRTSKIVTKINAIEMEDPTVAILRSLPEVVVVAASAVDVGDSDATTATTNDLPLDEQKTLADVLLALTSLHDRISSLEPKLVRFRKRLQEKDPITGAPRYGENTFVRVTNLLNTYDALSTAVSTVFGENWLKEDANSAVLISRLRTQAEREDEELRLAHMAAQAEEERIRVERDARKAQEEERMQREVEESRLARLQEEAELAERANQIRRARQDALEAERRAQEEAELADRQWVNSIQKGPEGVREQLSILRDAIGASDPKAFATALDALHTLFSQITLHPDNVNFRRVRRNHPKFHQDIGRHPGGREILIAAGFELGAIDGVPCFISKEPDIEKDMDGWAQWFDLLKATLAIIEEELIK